MKIGCEITLLIIEMAISKMAHILFLRIIQTKATRFGTAKTAVLANTID
jgi:hypothetical protein